MQWLGGRGAAVSPPPSKLNPPLSLLCPGSIQYGNSHDKLKVKVDETESWQSGGLLFDSIFGGDKEGLTSHANPHQCSLC